MTYKHQYCILSSAGKGNCASGPFRFSLLCIQKIGAAAEQESNVAAYMKHRALAQLSDIETESNTDTVPMNTIGCKERRACLWVLQMHHYRYKRAWSYKKFATS